MKKLPFYGKVYRSFTKLAHRYNWHHVKIIYPEKDMQLWCQWCGLRQTYKLTKGIDGKIRYGYLGK